ncbi:hypothetical protein, partial [Clostridioides difficile]|uniref:hypothetical protein n=1 Tax=Clostridioides difficile TaxID=1496 RepID=UPI001A9BE5A6
RTAGEWRRGTGGEEVGRRDRQNGVVKGVGLQRGGERRAKMREVGRERGGKVSFFFLSVYKRQ